MRAHGGRYHVVELATGDTLSTHRSYAQARQRAIDLNDLNDTRFDALSSARPNWMENTDERDTESDWADGHQSP